jgi:hypothetical protein
MRVPRHELDPLSPMPVLFDALIEEHEAGCVFEKTLTIDDPGVREQRTTAKWPHHLPGELVIGLTGQAACVFLRRRGVIDATWRGHGVRITDARYSAMVLLGERFFTRLTVLRMRRLGSSLHLRLAYRMWKLDADGGEVETYRSQQDAIFFPAL